MCRYANEYERLLGKSAEGTIGNEIYSPVQRNPSWIQFADRPKRRPLWRRVLRAIERRVWW